jgi:PRC-barrel domain
MMSKRFAAALTAAFFLTGAAVAAEVPTTTIGTYNVVQADTKNTNEKAAQDLDASRKANDKAVVEEKAGDARSGKSKVNYLTRQAPTDWTAEALIGRTVENGNGDNLGEINNVVINENGNVVAVVVGVGGFLGIGEKDVGVPFDALDFRTDAQMDRSDSASTADRADRRTDDRTARFDTEHDNMRIVLMTSKEDLEGAPDYAWLDEQETDGGKRDNMTTAKTEADCVAAKGTWNSATSTCSEKKM